MLDLTKENLPQIYNHVITKSEIESLSDVLIEKIFETSTGINELTSVTILKLLIDSLDKKLRSSISLTDTKLTIGRIKLEKSISPTILNLEEDTEFCRLKNNLEKRTETLKLQHKLNAKHQIDNPGIEFIGIVEASGEQVPVVSKKVGSGKEILKITIPR